ncbi:hypothetical protein PM082_000436 [Marasmius tenuissimus]|nr:hypothetical protein PM082_000436 [Marasmius tenuissimus]
MNLVPRILESHSSPVSPTFEVTPEFEFREVARERKLADDVYTCIHNVVRTEYAASQPQAIGLGKQFGFCGYCGFKYFKASGVKHASTPESEFRGWIYIDFAVSQISIPRDQINEVATTTNIIPPRLRQTAKCSQRMEQALASMQTSNLERLGGVEEPKLALNVTSGSVGNQHFRRVCLVYFTWAPRNFFWGRDPYI